MLHKMMYYCVFKIDRLYDWKKSPDTDVAVTLKKQKKNKMRENFSIHDAANSFQV